MKKIFEKIKKLFSPKPILLRKVYEWDERSGLGWIVTYGYSEEECDAKYYNGEYEVEKYYLGEPIGLGSDYELDAICNGGRKIFKVLK